jgi:hypothetical protein
MSLLKKLIVYSDKKIPTSQNAKKTKEFMKKLKQLKKRLNDIN